MSYKIDAVAVNSRTDWKHQLYPGAPQSRREERFPGVGERLVIKDVQMPSDLVVEGFLEGTDAADRELAIQDLHIALNTEKAREASTTPYKVGIHGASWGNMDLVRFTTVGPLRPLQMADGTRKVIQRCRWEWRKLR